MSEVDIKKIEKGLLEQLKMITLERANLEEENELCEISCNRVQKNIIEIEKSIKHASFLDQLNEQKKLDNYTEDEIENYIRLQVRRIASFICVNDFIDVEIAGEEFSKSNAYRKLCDMKTGYWKESIEKVYIEYEQERLSRLTKKIKNNTEIINAIGDITKDTVSVLPADYADMVIDNKEQKKQV